MNSIFDEDWQLDDKISTNESFEKFMLLSAYLDGEVTPEERRQVQSWIDSDPDFKKVYLKHLKLHEGIHHLPVSQVYYSEQPISESVFNKIDRQNQKRRLLIGGGLLVATLLSGITSNLWLKPSFHLKFSTPQTSTQVAQIPPESEGLIIALNQPIVELPYMIESDMK